MFNLVKWAYKLGQQTERQRVAALLNQAQRYPMRPKMIDGGIFGKVKDPADEDRIKQIEHGIEEGVREIINSITRPNNYDQESYSLLYPKDEK